LAGAKKEAKVETSAKKTKAEITKVKINEIV
jgi:hypothetical protein